MDPVTSTVRYCCVWKDGGLLYAYKGGGNEDDDLAALCLEMIPPHHRWYFHTVGKKTFGYLKEDEHVYFAIVDQTFGGSPQVLRFLQKLRDQVRRAGERGCGRSVPSLSSLCLQEQFLPVIQQLVASLEGVGTGAGVEWPVESASSLCDNGGGHNEEGGASSTKAPLLGKPSKQEKRKMKDHKDPVVTMGGIEMEEQHMRSSTDRGVRSASGLWDSNTQTQSASPLSSTRSKSNSSQNLQNTWCRQVWIVLAIDAAICIVLFIIWLVICHGTECIH